VRPDATLPSLVTAAGLIAFVLLGMLQAVFGPAIPALQERFGLAAATAGLALSAQFVGAVSGIFASGAVERAGLRLRGRITLSTALLALGAATLAVAPTWWLVVVGAVMAGLGFGGLSINFNVLFATGFGSRGAGMLNLLNACYGVGAIVGPLVVGLTPGADYRIAFGLLAVLAVGLLPLVRRAGPGGATATAATRGGSGALLVAFVFFYFIYVGVEAGIGGWQTKHLLSLGVAAGTAAGLPSLYWAAITAGRFLAVAVSRYVSPGALVTGALVGGCAMVALAHLPGLAPFAYAGAGLFLAPIYPTGLAWLGRLMPVTGATGVAVIAAANAGGVVLLPLIGLANDQAGPAAIPSTILAFGVLALLIALAVPLLARGAETRTTSA
jgi:FHS family glucose/mannose:H+ symporter-like MFS transporter